jgi:hypothetical protein
MWLMLLLLLLAAIVTARLLLWGVPTLLLLGVAAGWVAPCCVLLLLLGLWWVAICTLGRRTPLWACNLILLIILRVNRANLQSRQCSEHSNFNYSSSKAFDIHMNKLRTLLFHHSAGAAIFS